jgi:type II secretory pathway predicted ATPase ExeA
MDAFACPVEQAPRSIRPALIGAPLDIYAEHFGLRARPFSLTPDPAFLYWSPNHAKAFAMLEYAIATFAPITVITGEIGAGKTTLIRHLLRSVRRDMRIGLVSNAHSRHGALLHWALSALGEPIAARESYVQRFARLEALLRAERRFGRHTILIFDEAQNLSDKLLEELRCLVNLNDETGELLQVILVGQPELNRLVDHPNALQFSQRVAARFHLNPIRLESVGDYIAHRLTVVGASGEIFTPNACVLIAHASRGVPRVINQICEYALVYAFAEGEKTVDSEIVRQVVNDRQAQYVGSSPAS